MPKPLIYSYVRAKIVVALQQVQVYRRDELVCLFPYKLPESILPNL
jgi:hypothetical protein